MRKKIICILAAALVVSTTAAFGAIKERAFTVSPLIGGYVYDTGQHADTSLVLGARAGYNFTKAFAVEALYDYVTRSDATPGPFTNVEIHRFGGQALYHFFPENVLVPYLAAGYSGVSFNSGDDAKLHGAVDYGAGVKYFLTDDIAVRGDVRHILYRHDSRTNSNVEFMLGAYVQFGTAEPPIKAVAAPEPAPVSVVEEAPAAKPEPVIVTEAPAAKPEPVIAAEAPAPKPEPVKAAPEVAKATHVCDKPAVIAIAFDTNKAAIKPQYHNALNLLGNFLKEFPHAKGTIDGHTDSDGSKALNRKLSLARAENVRLYIINKFGINGSRISAHGYGADKPVASNKDAAGKAKNRRIEATFTCE